MFLLKKIISAFLYPVPVCLGFMLFGLLFLWLTRRQRTGRILVTLGVLLFAPLGYSVVANRIIGPLEFRYPALQDFDKIPEVKWIVVLGGGHGSNPLIQANARLNPQTLARLVEGIRLHRIFPETRLLLSGGGWSEEQPDSEVMEATAKALGVDEKSLVLESVSWDTEDEAVEVRKIVGNDPFILVTSASHMPRSMLLFQQVGLHPIPAPTDFEARDVDTAVRSPASFLPGGDGLCTVQKAVHEYLGILWMRMKGAFFKGPSLTGKETP